MTQAPYPPVTTYIHPAPPSWASQRLQTVMRLLQWKKQLSSFLTGKHLRQQPAKPTRSLLNNCQVSASTHQNRQVWTVTPPKTTSGKVIVYWHGGAYVRNITLFHWNLIEQLALLTGATIVVPDYPLAPAATWQEAYLFAETLYQQLLSQTPANQLIFMGDSAGGGLALGLAQKLHHDQQPTPAQIILLSPWLDISLTNPLIDQAAPTDAMLNKSALLNAAKAYAGNLPLQDYRLSPINGNFWGLGIVSLFIGTHDIFIADAQKLLRMANEQHFALNYFEYPKMFHVWMAITQLPESKHTLRQIAELVSQSG